MNTISIIVFIVILIGGILQIILFFKIWGMTNDVRQIKEFYFKQIMESKKQFNHSNTNAKFKIGTLVVSLKEEKQMYVEGLTDDGKYQCNFNGLYIGDFEESEIMEFNQWVEEVYNKK